MLIDERTFMIDLAICPRNGRSMPSYPITVHYEIDDGSPHAVYFDLFSNAIFLIDLPSDLRAMIQQECEDDFNYHYERQRDEIADEKRDIKNEMGIL